MRAAGQGRAGGWMLGHNSSVSVMAVPAIVSDAEFEAVQRSLKARSPRMMAPMEVGGPTLLTGICFCGCCGGAMTLRTGTSSVGRESRYYTCSTKARQGAPVPARLKEWAYAAFAITLGSATSSATACRSIARSVWLRLAAWDS
jgi:hypothetical protein